MDIDELWAIQEGQGTDPRGRDIAIVVPAADPEFGPYSRYSFVPAGERPGPGWRLLSQGEVHQALAQHELEPDR